MAPKIEGSLNRDGTKSDVITGGAAGDHTVTGIKLTDTLLSVINMDTQADLTSEFTISAADTINNGGGTATVAEQLQVLYSSSN